MAAGGAMGYVKKRSMPSLVAGVAFGGLAAVGAYHVSSTRCCIRDLTRFVSQASANPNTPYVGAGVSAVLAGVMGARAAKSGAVGAI